MVICKHYYLDGIYHGALGCIYYVYQSLRLGVWGFWWENKQCLPIMMYRSSWVFI